MVQSAHAEAPDLSRINEIGDKILPILNELRESEPIVWNPAIHAWMVLRNADVVAGYHRTVPLSNEALEVHMFGAIPKQDWPERIPHLTNYVARWFINMDPPRHSRIRGLMMKGFKPSIIEAIKPFVCTTIDSTLEKVSEQSECEIVDNLLRELTIRTIMQLIGVPPQYFMQMKEYSNVITDVFTRSRPAADALERADNAFLEMAKLFDEQIKLRKDSPRDDFLSQLVLASDAEGVMSDEDLIANLIFMFPAGHDSTTNTLALGLATLLKNRDLWPLFLGDSDTLHNAVMEMMRYVAMSALSLRVASEDFDWHGKDIHKGDAVLLMIAAANRDPRLYDNPEEFDASRRHDRTLVFGNGPHHCIGHLLAKLEIREFLPRILRRFPDMELADPELCFSSGVAFRGLDSLRIRWNQ